MHKFQRRTNLISAECMQLTSLQVKNIKCNKSSKKKAKKSTLKHLLSEEIKNKKRTENIFDFIDILKSREEKTKQKKKKKKKRLSSDKKKKTHFPEKKPNVDHIFTKPTHLSVESAVLMARPAPRPSTLTILLSPRLHKHMTSKIFRAKNSKFK